MGAIVLGGGALFGWVPVLLFLGYVGLIGRRYPGDWSDAAAIAWLTMRLVLSILAVAGFVTVEVIDVPETERLRIASAA